MAERFPDLERYRKDIDNVACRPVILESDAGLGLYSVIDKKTIHKGFTFSKIHPSYRDMFMDCGYYQIAGLYYSNEEYAYMIRILDYSIPPMIVNGNQPFSFKNFDMGIEALHNLAIELEKTAEFKKMYVQVLEERTDRKVIDPLPLADRNHPWNFVECLVAEDIDRWILTNDDRQILSDETFKTQILGTFDNT